MKKIIILVVGLFLSGNLLLSNIVKVNALYDPEDYNISLLNYGIATKKVRVEGRFDKVGKNFYIDAEIEYKYNDINGHCVGVTNLTYKYNGPANSKVYRSNAEMLDSETVNVQFLVIYEDGVDDWYGSKNVKV